jgi:hypothetical protein
VSKERRERIIIIITRKKIIKQYKAWIIIFLFFLTRGMMGGWKSKKGKKGRIWMRRALFLGRMTTA